jgi:hypothetical protein
MDKINDGGMAFPSKIQEAGCFPQFNRGMTLRQYYAGQAIVGIVAKGISPQVAAIEALKFSDALIKAEESK